MSRTKLTFRNRHRSLMLALCALLTATAPVPTTTRCATAQR
jgi:hypothetical protein